MGRHSAPDDDGDLLVAPVEAEPSRPRPRPRHAAPDAAGADDEPTDVIDPEIVDRVLDAPPRDVVDAVVVEDETLERAPVSAPPRPSPGPAPRRERPGRADLRLLRENSSVRARCAAALVLPFVLYTVVLLVISRLDVYLLWIWVPAILAGVLFGAQLDAAHKSAQKAPPTE